jgi:hypothetical protein
MATFPVLNSDGTRSMYPNTVAFEHLTDVTNLSSGEHIAFPWRAEPLGRYTLKLTNLSDAEVTTVRSFFRSMCGRFGQFQYVDPTGNLVHWSEDYTQAAWTKACTVGASMADPAGGNGASVLTGDGSGNCNLTQLVTVDPSVVGSLACFSVYLKAITASGAFNIYMTDGTTTRNVACTLTTTAWTRVSVPWVFGVSGNVTVGVGGNSSWTGTTQIAMFGPMLSMTAGSASYLRTPGFAALRPYCRFDQDTLDVQYRDINQTDISVKIAEFTPTDYDIPIISATLSIVSAYDPGTGNAIEFLSDWYKGVDPNTASSTYTLSCLKSGGTWTKQTDVYDLSPTSPQLGVYGVTPPFGYSYGNLGYDNSSLGALLSTLCLTFFQLNSSFGPAGTSHYSVYGAYIDIVLPGGDTRRYWARTANVVPSLGGSGVGDVTNASYAADGNLTDCAVVNGYVTGYWNPAWLQLYGWTI